MEKCKAHHPLCEVKTCIHEFRVRATGTALAGGAALGFDFAEILRIVENLTPQNFYKSMTSYNNHQMWQDVYRPQVQGRELYIKLTIIEELLIVSFKEL